MCNILQFGTGRFLRGFFDCIVPEARSITVVQSRTDSDGAELINAQSDGYHVWTRGIQKGQVVDEFERIHSLARALDANTQWQDVLTVGASSPLKLIVSNTTEAGLSLDPSDNQVDFANDRPASWPAKLLAILFQRFQAGLAGLTILPLELVEYNASRLISLVKRQATQLTATADPDFLKWLESDNRWLNNLVDRIVVSVSDSPPWGFDDPLAVVAEPFRMLAIEQDGGPRNELPAHNMVTWVDDLQPFFLRKVRILNGLHTAMVAHSMPQGFETVLEVMHDAAERCWIETLLNEEILPALAARGIHEPQFAKAVLERFENPFFRHRLVDIANGHASKLTTRIQPTVDDYRSAFGKDPEKLCHVIASKTAS